MKRSIVAVAAFFVASSLSGKIVVPESKNDYFNLIERHQYVVLHYINYEKVAEDKTRELALAKMKSTFGASANESAHVLAGITFIGTNSDRESGLIARYGLQDDYSAVLLFKNGQVVKAADGKIAKLTGAFDQDDLGQFIQQYFGNYIGRQVQAAQARRATQPVQQVTRVIREEPVYTYSSPRYSGGYWGGGYGRGYGRGYYGGYGPRFGLGVGFGGGRRRRRGRGGFYFGF